MVSVRIFDLMLLVCLVGGAQAHAQNTPARATPQTGSAAPAGIGPAATAAQAAEAGAARNSATHGSRSKGQSRPSATQPASSQPRPGAGITGVPRYRAGFRQQGNQPAKAATASVTVTGVNDGSTNTDGTLPGIPQMHNAFGIAKGTPIQVRLQQPVDSGHARNGDMIHGVLAEPIADVPAGAPVQLTVVAVAAAGQISSNGELSLQVVSVDGRRVLSDVITAEGEEGNKLMPDDAPARGTEAIFPANQPLTLPAG